MYKKICIVLTALLISGTLFQACQKAKTESKEVEKTEAQSNEVVLSKKSVSAIGLQAEIVTLRAFTGSMAIPAQVIVNQDNEALVGSLVQGRVSKVFVKAGDAVRAGQVLMTVEGLGIGEIKASYLKAKASLDFTRAACSRQKTLSEQNIGAHKNLLESQADYEKALAEFNAEDKKIHSIGLSDEEILSGRNNPQTEHTPGALAVKAPISGTVVERNVVVGQQIDNGMNAFKIVNTSSVWIDGQIYESDINKISNGSAVSFSPTSFQNEKFNGKISFIGKVIDEKTRTITVRAEFSNPKGSLLPQMFGELILPVSKNAKAILVPSDAIVKINNASYAFIAKNDSVFYRQAVVTAPAEGDFVEVRKGLKEGEKVIVKGAFYLKSELLKSELGEAD